MSAYEELCDEIFLVVAAFMLRNLRNIFVYEGANGRLNNIVEVDEIFDEGRKEFRE